MDARACDESAIIASWEFFDSNKVKSVLLWATEPSCSTPAVGLGSCVASGGLEGCRAEGAVASRSATYSKRLNRYD
jgi:hypothetical protein